VHQHRHQSNTGVVLGWSLAATAAFVAIELIAGFKAHSLALLSDAGHNFTDALALLLAIFGFYLQSRPADEEKTYGYHRAGVLAAFVNAVTLLLLALFIFYESYQRLLAPPVVDAWTMLVVAALGLAVNMAIMWGLRADKDHDLNIRAAFVHMLGDALGSVGIIIGSVAIRYTGWQRIDPVLSILIGLLIIWTAWDIVKESLNILLEGLPRGMHLNDVVAAIRGVEGVLDVHDLHVWSLGSAVHALSCHVRIDDVPASETDSILQRINSQLAARFHIHHTTIQFEHALCAISEHGCSLPSGGSCG
jgi:cobalt-zinc-cadmium efflux system protein